MVDAPLYGRQAPSSPVINAFVSADRYSLHAELRLPHEHAVLIVESGMGALTLNGRKYPVSSGRCYYALPNMPFSIEPYFNEFAAILVRFDRLMPLERSAESIRYAREDGGFADWGELASPMPERMLQLARDMADLGHSHDLLGVARRERCFHEWMYELTAANTYSSDIESDNGEVINRVMKYIDLHYHENLKRSALAGMAGFSPEYFSSLFKQISGRSLTDYITMLRIRHIKERLLFAGARLSDVAKEVGYKDEYYVSRRFKQEVGISPTNYVLADKRIVSLNPHLTMHLLALGIVPAATSAYPWGFGEYDSLLRGAGCECRDWTTDFTNDELAVLRPDLLIGIDNLDHERLHACRLLAPTLVLPWYIGDWRGHFHILSQVCRRSVEEKEWLSQFDKKVDCVRLAMSESGMTSLTATIVNIRDTTSYVYLNRGMGSQVVYKELKFNPPPGVRTAIGDRASAAIELCDILPGFEADLMIVVTAPSPLAAARTQDMLASEPWVKYRKQGGLVRHADMSRWHGYDPLSIQWQLLDIQQWLDRPE